MKNNRYGLAGLALIVGGIAMGFIIPALGIASPPIGTIATTAMVAVGLMLVLIQVIPRKP